MRKAIWLPVWAGLFAANASAGLIQFQVTSLGGNEYQYNYILNGFTLAADQAIDIVFTQGMYVNNSLINGVPANPNATWDLEILQPDTNLSSDGLYSLQALVNNPSLAGTFSVQFQWAGVGQPGSQSYSVDTYNGTGPGAILLSSGTPTNTVSSVPEPSSLWLGGFGLLFAGVLFARHRALEAA